MGGSNIIYLIPSIISIYLATCLAIISIHKSRDTLNILFSVICFIWALTSFAYVAHLFTDSNDKSILIERIIHFFYCYAAFIHVLFFHKLMDIKNNKIPAGILLLSIAFSFLSFTNYYIYDIKRYSWGYIAITGPAFYFFLLFSSCVIIYITVRVLASLVDEQNHISKLKLKYALFSFLFATILTMLNIIPLIGYDLYPMGNFIFIPMSFLAYGILKYRILNIKSVLFITLQYLLEAFIFILPNIIIFIILQPFIRGMHLITLAIVSIVWFYINFFYMIKIRLFVNYFFNNANYKLKKAEKKFIENILLLKNVDDLKNEFLKIIKETLNLTIAEFFFMTSTKNSFKTTTGKKLELDTEIVTWLIKTNHLTEQNMVRTNPYYDSYREKLLQIFLNQNCNIMIPMVQYDELVGIILFNGKATGITRDEVQFINNIKQFVVIALFNSIIYQNVTKLKETLEEKTEKLSSEIIERQHAENVLIESEARYRLLAENIIDTILVIDLSDLTLNYISPSVEKLLLYTSEELVGSKIQKILSPDSLETVVNEIEKNLNIEKTGRAQSLILKIEVLKKDNTKVWVEFSTYFIRDSDDTPISIIGVARDISERLSAEEEKYALESKLIQAQKMESIGILAGGIAHDFNNILMAIMGYTQLAIMYIPDENNKAILKVKQIETAGKRAKELVSQILAFSRQSTRQKISINLATVISEAVKMLSSSIPSTIEIVKDFQKNLKPAFVDPIQIHQIIINLCTNSYHAMEKAGGKCHVGLSNEVIDKNHAKAFEIPPGDFLKITISDTGNGIEPEIISRIFDPYFTTKEIGRGTGMGLAVVHGIVMGHKGAITVESNIGAGTTFTIYIPASEKTESKPETSTDKLSSGKEKILYVDDEQVLVEFTSEALESFGYEVTATTKPLNALEIFTNAPDAFDVVITDLTMPEMTGEKLAEEIHKIRDDIPIILCTGYSDPISDERKLCSGISDILLKPLSLEELTTAIRRALSS